MESFNGRFREGRLNQHWFKSLTHARHEINEWRQHYNEERPHSSLNYQPPAAFARKVA
ncbi:MAG: integrase core domain-containing protein [Gammaproteobacteria bacterium]|nr:integrase core domain-containing protein [Gammaproteobacteria bacterium]